MLVVVLDESVDLALEIGDRFERAASDRLVRDQCEPALDLVQPGAVSGREVQMKPRPPRQPRAHSRMLVRGVVVANEMNLEPGRHAGLNVAQEREELLMPMARLALGENAAVGKVESGKKGSRSVPHIAEAF